VPEAHFVVSFQCAYNGLELPRGSYCSSTCNYTGGTAAPRNPQLDYSIHFLVQSILHIHCGKETREVASGEYFCCKSM